MGTQENAKQNAALAYAKIAWSIAPFDPVTKKPLLKDWLEEATTNEKKIRKWWEQFPDANIAVVTGAKSKIIVLDVDPRNGGFESLERLENDFGSLPATLIQQSGGGGKHYFFRYPTDGLFKFRSKLVGYPGIDILSDGRCVIVEPSTHVSGGSYAFEF